jgi:Domain of unknown function (DUF6048)
MVTQNSQPRTTLKLFCNIFIFFLSVNVFAQSADTAKFRADTVRNRFIPTGIRFGTDLISIAKTQYVKSFSGWEVNAEVDFYRYYLAMEYGSWARTYFPENGVYTNDGNYFRVGVDVNFLTKDPEKNVFFLGLRSGHSMFSENFVVSVEDPLWGILPSKQYVNSDVKARWMELTTGLRVKMWKFIWMGYTARFKFGLKTKNAIDMLPSDVPGFGRTDKQTTWGFNYVLLFRIPLTKKQ